MSDLNQKFDEINNTPDYTSQFDPEDINKNRNFCILCYIGILVLIPMLAGDKNSRYTRFHVSQGFTLWICEVILGIIFVILGLIPGVKVVASIVSVIVWLFFIVLSIIGIINTYNGRAKEIPIFGGIHLIKY